ncbi:MAG: hypothetical protein H7Z41_08695 [Cytophagales bacterium]|nr:hypothetical protein [Armatimonadota bacterium]
MQTIPRLSFRNAAVSGALLTVSILGVGIARADVKIVSETTIKGLPEQAQQTTRGDFKANASQAPVVSTVYLKGEKRRSEVEGRVTIYDCATDALYTLNTADKTYTVTSFSKSLDNEASASNPILSLIKIDTGAVTLTPQTTSKIIAGKPATSYTFGLTLKVRPADPSLAEMIPNIESTVKGEQWFSESIAAPATCARMAKANFVSSLPLPIAGASEGLKTLADKISAIKGTPLSSRIVVTLKAGDGKAADANVLPIPKDPIILTTEVKTITEDPLADSLFTIPAEYKKVDVAPKPGTSTPVPPAPEAAPPPVAK